MKRYSKKKIFFLIIWNIVISILLIEATLHVFKPAPLFSKITVSDEGRGYHLSENEILIYEPTPGTAGFNNQGYRGIEYPKERKGSNVRILMLGDSVTEGPNLLSNQSFPGILEEMMGRKYEILNFGVQGYNLLQEVEYLKVKGLEYQPDHVIFAMTYNDLEIHSGQINQLSNKIQKMNSSSFYSNYYKMRGGADDRLMYSHIYRYIRYFTSKPQESFEDNIYYKLDKDRVNGLLHEIKRLSDKHDFKLSFIFLPINGPPEQMQLMEKLVSEADIHYFNLDEYITEKYGQEFKVSLLQDGDPCHFTFEGHPIVAQIIYQNSDAIFGIITDVDLLFGYALFLEKFLNKM